MATILITDLVPDFALQLGAGGDPDVDGATIASVDNINASKYTIELTNGIVVDFTGSFTFVGNTITGGTVSNYAVRRPVGGGTDVAYLITGSFDAAILGGGALPSNLTQTVLNDADSLVGTAADETFFAFGGEDTVVGGGGNDTLDGGDGDDAILAGGAGDDAISGGAGNDNAWGESGADTLDGGAGDDHLRGNGDGDSLLGGLGDDTLRGQFGDDTLDGGDGADEQYGGAGDDSVVGGAGNDTLNGNSGDDTVVGGAGDDVVRGQGSRDLLYGGDGNDRLLGMQGFDTLDGGAGNDTLTGGAANDTLTGGDGADVFVFGEVHGDDVITDFVPGTDRIQIVSDLVDSVDDLTIADVAGNAVISFEPAETPMRTTITLIGVSADDLSSSDFIL